MKTRVIPQQTVLRLFKVKYPDSVDFNTMYSWCRANCSDTYYSGHDWNTATWVTGGLNRCMEFVNESDAVLFALRWL